MYKTDLLLWTPQRIQHPKPQHCCIDVEVSCHRTSCKVHQAMQWDTFNTASVPPIHLSLHVVELHVIILQHHNSTI